MKYIVSILFSVLVSIHVNAQTFSLEELDTLTMYTDLRDALEVPDQVYALDLSKQKLNEFPREIFKFRNLNILILKKNKIEEIPDSISVLKHLQQLNFAKNKLTEINDSIYGLLQLREIDFSENQISVISYKIAQLNELRSITLWGLPISKIPQEIYELPNLNYLDIRQIYFSPKDRDYIRENLPNAEVKISNVCNCGN